MLNVLKLIIFDILLPTIDTVGDVTFSIEAFTTQNFGIGILQMLPVILNGLFQLYKWKTSNFDSVKEKQFTWIFVLLNVWPQYQAVKLLFWIFIMDSKDAIKEKQDRIKKELSYIEPFIEAIPELFISCSIFGILVTRDSGGPNNGAAKSLGTFFTSVWSEDGINNSKIKEVFGTDTFGISNEIMFPLNILISLIGGIKSVVSYLGSNHMRNSSKDGCSYILYLARFIYVVASFLTKMHIVFQISIMTAAFHYHGFVTFLIVFVIFVYIPALFGFPSLAQYLGFKKFMLH